MATALELRTYLGRLSTTLMNYGATFPVPTLDSYESGEIGFSFEAFLPGFDHPTPAVIKLVEVWEPEPGGIDFQRVEYEYDFIDYPLNRRRAFHRHDVGHFLHEFGVTVHEHCEDPLGEPLCDHFYGLPIGGDEAIRSFTILWGQPVLSYAPTFVAWTSCGFRPRCRRDRGWRSACAGVSSAVSCQKPTTWASPFAVA
jgi:hypothetical protein